MSEDPNRRFRRWLNAGSENRKARGLKCQAMLQPIIESNGFQQKAKDYDGFHSAPQFLYYEKMNANNFVDSIDIQFDKRTTIKFRISADRNLLEPPTYPCLRGTELVWRQGEDDRFSWWGAKWWDVRKEHAFESGLKHAAQALPQAFEFLETGTPGPNIGFLRPTAEQTASLEQ